MPRTALQKYMCPRCGYETNKKPCMRKHLYDMKTQCPGIKNASLELTNDIKEHILKNRVYDIPKEVPIQTLIQQNQTIHNYIANMDTFTKLNHLATYENLEIADFESIVEQRYKRDARRFQTDGFRGNIEYNQQHFLEMIAKVTEAKEVDEFSVVYDQENDRIHVSMGGGNWDKYLRKPGITYLIDTVVSYCLEYYEIYLCRKMNTTKILLEKQSLTQSLLAYYRFIASFDIKPYVFGKQDAQVLYNDADPEYDSSASRGDVAAYRLVDACNKLYNDAVKMLTETQKRATLKEVMDIIKTNTKINISELNKKIMNILQIDVDFKEHVLLNTWQRHEIESE